MKKILVVTNGNIGDFVLATSALKLLRQGLPEDEITLITSVRVKDFIEGLNKEWIDSSKTLFFPRNDNHKKTAVAGAFIDNVIYTDFSFTRSFIRQRVDQVFWFVKNYFKIKRSAFDDCVFLDHSRFFAKVMPLTGIKNLIGPSTWWSGDKVPNPNISSLTKAVPLPENSDNTHMVERYQTIIRSYLDNCNLSTPLLPKTKQETAEKVNKLLNKTNKYSVTFSLRGDNIKGNKKIYPVTHAIEIIKRLHNQIDADYYMLGTKIFYDDAEYIKYQIPEAKIHNLCSKTSLPELKTVFEQTDLLISVDTGAIHIAAVTNTNIIGLYGANDGNSFPVSSRSTVLYVKQPCSPCNYTRTVLGIPCPYGDNPKCLESVTPDMVSGAALKILKGLNK
ncbi:MAG: hypothetical protein LBR69_07290 [Endomicrobium sp.]|jgi:heptosyltransferase-2|nr:hypothetical protein [Endomicrobium sp.]